MATELGEVRVRIEEEGAQDAADSIGDAVSGGEPGGGQSGGGSGGIGDLLGGISAKLAGILGFVAFLATLKPIQELFKGLQRLFSIAILPLVSLLNTFLQPILQRLLRFIGELDFDNLLQDLTTKLSNILETQLSRLFEDIPGVGSDEASNFVDSLQTAGRTGEWLVTPTEDPAGDIRSGIGQVGRTLQEQIEVVFDLNTERSRSSLDEGVSNISSEETQRNGVGGQ